MNKSLNPLTLPEVVRVIWIMQFRKFRIILVLLVMSSCFSSGQTQSEPGTGIEGVITFGPTQGGPIRPGIPSSAPLANATFVVENEKGAVASFTTDGQGRFRVSLTPGHSVERCDRALFVFH